MADRRNYWRGTRWRELVHLVMRAEGVPVEMRAPTKRVSDAFADDRPATELTGVPGFAITTRHEFKQDWSAALDSAVFAARSDAVPYAAAVQFRAGRETEESFVVMTLKDFCGILRERQKGAS